MNHEMHATPTVLRTLAIGRATPSAPVRRLGRVLQRRLGRAAVSAALLAQAIGVSVRGS